VLHLNALLDSVKKVLSEVKEHERRSLDQLDVDDVVGQELVDLAQVGAFSICQHRVPTVFLVLRAGL